MKKHAVILGGLGLIGQAVEKQLKKHGFSVEIIDLRKANGSDISPTHHHSIFETKLLSRYLQKAKPDVIINCVNLATVCSRQQEQGYQQLVHFYTDLSQILRSLPKLHYVQIGTTGSGGLGFNIPFTHGESIEDIPIIHKAAFSGISTALLTVLSRTFDNGTRISEIKPGLAIFSENIVEMRSNDAQLLILDGGESGYYTYPETALLTSFMGFTTDRSLAEKIYSVIWDKSPITHSKTGYDVIAKINEAIITSTDIDKQLHKRILKSMRAKLSEPSIIATGNLGPVTVTRDLLLAHVAHNNPAIKNERQFRDIFHQDKSVCATMRYLESAKPEIVSTLKKNCTYTNFLSLQTFDQTDQFWQRLANFYSNNLPSRDKT